MNFSPRKFTAPEFLKLFHDCMCKLFTRWRGGTDGTPPIDARTRMDICPCIIRLSRFTGCRSLRPTVDQQTISKKRQLKIAWRVVVMVTGRFTTRPQVHRGNRSYSDNSKMNFKNTIRVVTFQSGANGKYCYMLYGGLEEESEFRYADHSAAYTAASNQIEKRSRNERGSRHYTTTS